MHTNLATGQISLYPNHKKQLHDMEIIVIMNDIVGKCNLFTLQIGA